MIKRGQLWWVDLGEPHGSEPGYRRPVLVLQDDTFNKSQLATTLVASITTNLGLAAMPGNIFLPRKKSRLSKDSIINITQLTTIDKSWLEQKIHILDSHFMQQVETSLKLIFALDK